MKVKLQKPDRKSARGLKLLLEKAKIREQERGNRVWER